MVTTILDIAGALLVIVGFAFLFGLPVAAIIAGCVLLVASRQLVRQVNK